MQWGQAENAAFEHGVLCTRFHKRHGQIDLHLVTAPHGLGFYSHPLTVQASGFTSSCRSSGGQEVFMNLSLLRKQGHGLFDLFYFGYFCRNSGRQWCGLRVGQSCQTHAGLYERVSEIKRVSGCLHTGLHALKNEVCDVSFNCIFPPMGITPFRQIDDGRRCQQHKNT